MSECGQAEDRGGGWSNVLVVGVALNFQQLRLSLALLSLLLLSLLRNGSILQTGNELIYCS